MSCLDGEAAKLLVGLLKDRDPEEFVMRNTANWVYRKWPFDEFDPKDLRRASLYWLGHSTSILVLHLMKHARHRNIETTMQYMRRPTETLEQWTELDLEA